MPGRTGMVTTLVTLFFPLPVVTVLVGAGWTSKWTCGQPPWALPESPTKPTMSPAFTRWPVSWSGGYPLRWAR